MTDILLIFPRPSAHSPQKNPPLSIFYPGEAAAQSGFKVEYWDERFDSFDDFRQKAQRAKIFGISSLSGYMLGRTIRILKLCKDDYPLKPTVLGGVHATFLPENSLKENFVDFVLLGEGEERLTAFLKVYCNGLKLLEVIDGIGYKNNRKIVVNPRKEVLDLSQKYTSPVSDRTARYFEIIAKRNEITLPTSRGCPWANNQGGCTFCSVHQQYLGKYRHIPFEKWAEDIDKIYSLHQFTQIELEDENSAHFIRRLDQYAKHLQKKSIKYHLHLRADQLQDEKLVRELAETGCIRIHIGVESGNHRIRNTVLRKGEETEHFRHAAKLMAKYGIEGAYTYMIGTPSETYQEMLETLKMSDQIKHMHPRGTSRSTVYVMMALPGTDIFEIAKKDGWNMPKSMGEWGSVSTASNPALPRTINNLYFIAGLHHNRYHKTAQNFPGLWRLLILPLEIICELRWKLRFFKGFSLEKLLIETLITWRSKKSKGKT